jgi:small-conductance mechanosensitive channel
MKWIIDDICSALAQLKRWQTWFVLGLISVFAGLAYLIGSFAFRTDALLVYLHRTAGACRELTNGTIIFMFCGMIFFLFAALLTLGEFQQYFEFKQRNAHHQAHQSLLWGIGWGVGTIGIAISALVFFNQYCR